MNNLSPIVLFVYKRLDHTKKTINALKKNTLAQKSILYIYSDGFKDNSDKKNVLSIRSYIKRITGFKEIIIIESSKNLGLANSIINGVTNVINKYGKIIVVEDDIVTSPNFLEFMNDALSHFQNNDKIWHISGWNYPITSSGLEETFVWTMMNCWGWGTWVNKWKHFEKNIQKNIYEFPLKRINEFNLDGALNNWDELVQNLPGGRYNTWAIFWHFTIFKNNGLCLNPTKSFVNNIGFDNSGENTSYRYNFNINKLNTSNKIIFSKNNLIEDKVALEKVKYFFSEIKIYNNKNLEFSKLINNFDTFIQKLPKQNYIIYGAGVVAKYLINYMKDEILYLIDRDKNKIGSTFENKQVYALDKLKNNNHKILLSVLGREKEITNDLVNFGVYKENIVVLSI